ncbi:MAG: DUF4276 family protein [Pirellulales bacterium]|nr:DUF4276 family protein [Pirellulales bacterium]
MRIAIIVEGKTEKVFKPFLNQFLKTRLAGRMPKLDFVPQDGRIPTGDKLYRVVTNLLNDRRSPADAVIGLTDIYTGFQPHEFQDANDAKHKMKQWVGDVAKFYPHAALYDFEAWLLPYWSKIQKLAGSNRTPPGNNPEEVNHNNPPACRLKEIYRVGTCRNSYVKTRDAPRILQGEDLSVAIEACRELKDFVNRIIELSGGEQIY